MKITSEGVQQARALDVDPRAGIAGRAVAEALSDVGCAAIFGSGHTGKTQTAMVTRALLDPSGSESFHTSAAILNTNAAVAPGDRSATWQTWTAMMEAHSAGIVPKVVVIDEAGSSAPPNTGFGLDTMRALALLNAWKNAGTKFVVIGHDRERLLPWAKLLSPNGYAIKGAGDVDVVRTRPIEAPVDNALSQKNRLPGSAGQRTPPGNAAFFRGGELDDM